MMSNHVLGSVILVLSPVWERLVLSRLWDSGITGVNMVSLVAVLGSWVAGLDEEGTEM